VVIAEVLYMKTTKGTVAGEDLCERLSVALEGHILSSKKFFYFDR
jgi:hypothetical protein